MWYYEIEVEFLWNDLTCLFHFSLFPCSVSEKYVPFMLLIIHFCFICKRCPMKIPHTQSRFKSDHYWSLCYWSMFFSDVWKRLKFLKLLHSFHIGSEKSFNFFHMYCLFRKYKIITNTNSNTNNNINNNNNNISKMKLFAIVLFGKANRIYIQIIESIFLFSRRKINSKIKNLVFQKWLG